MGAARLRVERMDLPVLAGDDQPAVDIGRLGTRRDDVGIAESPLELEVRQVRCRQPAVGGIARVIEAVAPAVPVAAGRECRERACRRATIGKEADRSIDGKSGDELGNGNLFLVAEQHALWLHLAVDERVHDPAGREVAHDLDAGRVRELGIAVAGRAGRLEDGAAVGLFLGERRRRHGREHQARQWYG